MASIIQSLYYASPYYELPPGIQTAGITLMTTQPSTPITNPILVMRFRMAASTTEVIGVSATSGPGTSATTANFQPDFPLSSLESYMIDIIWVASGTPPENIDWTQAVTSAPVTAAEATVLSATVVGDPTTGAAKVIAEIEYGPSGIGVGAVVTVFSQSLQTYVGIGNLATQGNTVTIDVNGAGYPGVYFIGVQAVIPTTNSGGQGSFAIPFSFGPPSLISDQVGVPQPIKTLSSAVYTGSHLLLSWALNTIANCVDPDSSIIQVLTSDSVEIASFIGGINSASIPIDLEGLTGLQIKASSTVAGNFTSNPISWDQVTQAPTVTNAVANKSNGKITATISNIPAKSSAHAYLMDGPNVLAGPVDADNNNVVTFDYSTSNYNVEGMVGVSVVANASDAEKVIFGPNSTPAVLLTTIPVITSVMIYTDPSDATQWQADIQWNRLPDDIEQIESYTVTVVQGSTTVATQTVDGTSTSLTFLKSKIDPMQSQTIQIFATGISQGTSPVLTLTVIFAPPLLSSITTTKDDLTIVWTAPVVLPSNTPQVSYQPVITATGSVPYYGKRTSLLQSSILLTDMPYGSSPVVTVNVIIGPVTLVTETAMATTCSATPLLDVVPIGAVTTDPSTNITTLNWSTITSANSYTIAFTDTSRQNVTSTTSSYTFPAALAAGTILGFTIQATGVSNTVPVNGPVSNVVMIPTNVTNINFIRFNGSNGILKWDDVRGAVLFNVFVYDNQSTEVYSGTTDDTSISFSFTSTAGIAYSAIVQPVMPVGTAFGCAKTILFSTGLYVSQQPGATAYPYVYPASGFTSLGSATAAPPGQVITMFLPELGSSAGSLGTTPITVDPFSIAPSGNAALPYKLTIAIGTVWTFNTDAIRLTLQTAYINFLTAIESPPGLPGANAFGISLVQSAIAALIPQTFAEQLFYNFGFSTTSTVGAGYVDLRPGMILRVLSSDYVSIAQNGLGAWINGYAGSTTLDFEIGSYQSNSNWLLGFDAMLSQLSAQGVITINPPATSQGNIEAGLASAVDLYYPQFLLPYYRLYFPKTVDSAWGYGSNTTNSNFSIVAAGKYADLQNTTVTPSSNPVAYFRGRSVVEVMIRVSVNGNERIVPIGTTISNLLEQLGLRTNSSGGMLQQLRVYRSIAAAITATDNTALPPVLELRVDWNGLSIYGTGNGFNALSIPLLPGDRIETDKVYS